MHFVSIVLLVSVSWIPAYKSLPTMSLKTEVQFKDLNTISSSYCQCLVIIRTDNIDAIELAKPFTKVPFVIVKRGYESAWYYFHAYIILVKFKWVRNCILNLVTHVSYFSYDKQERIYTTPIDQNQAAIQGALTTVIILTTAKYEMTAIRSWEIYMKSSYWISHKIIVMFMITWNHVIISEQKSGKPGVVSNNYDAWMETQGLRGFEGFGGRFDRVGCKSVANCYLALDTLYKTAVNQGKNVVWLSDFSLKTSTYLNELLSGIPPGISSPFDRKSPSRIRSSVFYFVTSPRNNASSKDRGRSSHINMNIDSSKAPFVLVPRGQSLRHPQNGIKRQFSAKDMSVAVLVGNTQGYFFITAQNVSATVSSFTHFFCPFDLWSVSLFTISAYAICLLLHVVSLIKLPGSQPPTFCALLFWAIRVFLDQSTYIEQKRNQQPVSEIHALTVLWIFFGALLSNFYKSFISSEFLAPFPFRTPYENISQLVNEEFRYIGLTNVGNCTEKNYFPLQEAISYIQRETPFSYSTRYSNYIAWGDTFYNVRFFPLAAGIIRKEIQKSCPNLPICQRETRIMTELKESILICKEHLEEFVLQMEAYPSKRIAYIVDREEFKLLWPIFWRIMKKHPHLKFSHNLGSNENRGFLDTREAYYLPTGINYTLHRNVPLRLKMLVTSGILSLWEEWDRIRFAPKGLQSGSVGIQNQGTEDLNDNGEPKGLSLTGSDLYLVFYALLFGIGLATMLGIIECGLIYFRMQINDLL